MKKPIKIINRDDVFHNSYWLTMELGLIFSLLIALFAVKTNFNPKIESIVAGIESREEIFIEEIVQTKQDIKIPAPPRPVVPIEVPNDEILDDEIIELNAELELGESFDIPLPPRPLNDTEVIEEEVFVVVEQPPVLIGGINAVQKVIQYPDMARKAGIEGRVIVQFVIDKEGKVSNPFIVRGIGGGCDEEALRAVSKASFRPGMQRGKPVQVRYTLPITFKLKNSDNI